MRAVRNMLAFIGLLIGSSLLFSQPVIVHGKLWVDGVNLKDKNGDVVILRGMSYGWNNWWPQFYNENTVQWLHKDWGCTVLRAAVGVEPTGAYLDKPEWSKKLAETVVDAAIKENIYVIIDWHSHNIQLNEAKAFFIEMSAKYGKYPNVIYEIFNEPDFEKWSEVKAYAIEIIAAIRKNDPDNIIIVGTPNWSQYVDVAANDPITGYKNIMYTLHFYASTHKQWLRDKADTAIKKGLPIFVTESGGTFSDGNGTIDYDEYEIWMKWLAKYQISWVIWSIEDKEETCATLKPGANPNGHWTENDLTESGIFTRKLLRSFIDEKK